MAGMIDGSSVIWTCNPSSTGGMEFQGYESKAHLSKKMMRQAITDLSMVADFENYLKSIVSDIEQELKYEKSMSSNGK